MSDPFCSRAELRRYVEAELKHTGLRDRPELSIAFQNPRYLVDAPPAHPLWWTIESARMDRTGHLISRHYLLEARYNEREFVIWFGTLIGFKGSSPRNVIRPAVHLISPDSSSIAPPRTLRSKLTAVVNNLWASPATARSATPNGREGAVGCEMHSLGAVISWMLEHEDHASAAWDPMVYPLSGSRY
jgi:hypothetical protein